MDNFFDKFILALLAALVIALSVYDVYWHATNPKTHDFGDRDCKLINVDENGWHHYKCQNTRAYGSMQMKKIDK